LPLLFGIYLGATVEVPQGQLRANMVVLFVFFYGGIPLLLNSILFLSESTWNRALIKYSGQENA
jgi:hypothetical protein